MAKVTVTKKIQLTGHGASVFALTKGLDERHFLSGAGDGWVVEWNLDNPDPGRLIAKIEGQVFSLHSPKGAQILVAGDMNGGVHFIDLEYPERTKNIAHHQKGVFDFVQNGDWIFSAGGEGKLTKWSLAERRSVESLHLTNRSLRCLDFCESRNEIAVGASDFAIYLLDADTLEIKKSIPTAHDNSVFAVRFSPDDKYLLSGGRDAHLKVWDLDNNLACISSQPAHMYAINSIVFSPDGRFFATASRDRTIKIWDATTFELLKVLDTVRDGCHVNSVNNLLWLPHQNSLISCSDDRTIIIWEVENEKF